MRVKLDHKPGKPEVVLRLSKEEANLIRNALSYASESVPLPENMLGRMSKMAGEVKQVLDTYPEAAA